MDPREFFRCTELKPDAVPIGQGYCRCNPSIPAPMYRKGTGKAAVTKCDVCFSLSQFYPLQIDGKANRLGLGCYLLIERTIRFWGNHRLDRVNPAIQCQPATGRITKVVREMIVTPPEPPWMFVAFSASTGTDQLVVTDDNRLLQFSGKTLIQGTVVRKVNRTQVMQMRDVGMTAAEWKTYLNAFAADTPEGIGVMTAMAEHYPAINDLRWLPPVDAPEHLALKTILKE